MKEKYVGQGGRWMVFAGAPMFVVALLMCRQGLPLENIIGKNKAAYATLGIVLVIFAVSMYLYGRIPRRLTTLIGIVGWLLTITLSCWYFWFGPGALK